MAAMQAIDTYSFETVFNSLPTMNVVQLAQINRESFRLLVNMVGGDVNTATAIINAQQGNAKRGPSHKSHRKPQDGVNQSADTSSGSVTQQSHGPSVRKNHSKVVANPPVQAAPIAAVPVATVSPVVAPVAAVPSVVAPVAAAPSVVAQSAAGPTATPGRVMTATPSKIAAIIQTCSERRAILLNYLCGQGECTNHGSDHLANVMKDKKAKTGIFATGARDLQKAALDAAAAAAQAVVAAAPAQAVVAAAPVVVAAAPAAAQAAAPAQAAAQAQVGMRIHKRPPGPKVLTPSPAAAPALWGDEAEAEAAAKAAAEAAAADE